jgi:hypothetical protein
MTWGGESEPNAAAGLSGLLVSAGVPRVMQLLQDVTGVDPATAYAQAQAQITKFLKLWNNLGQDIGNKILQFVNSDADLADIKSAAQLISSGNQSGLATLLQGKLTNVAFFQTGLGQYLETIASQGVVKLLDSPLGADVQKAASDTLGVLDGADVQSMLTNLQKTVISKLDLTWLYNAATKISNTSFSSLDALLQAKLAAFLDKAIPAVAVQDLQNVAKVVTTLYDNFSSFYKKAQTALNRSYAFSFSAAYQSATAKSAMLDLSLNFAPGVGDPATLTGILRDAINGKLDQNNVLVNVIPGVTVNKGQLTHSIKRSSHAEVNMPFLSASWDDITSAAANMTTADATDGRIFVYSMQAQNSHIEQVKARFLRTSTVSVAANISIDPKSPLQVFGGNALTYSYQFQQATNNMTMAAFNSQAGQYLDTFFGSTLTTGKTTPAAWLGNITGKANPNGNAVLGNTLLSINVNVPTSVTAAWIQPAVSSANEASLGGAFLNAMRNLIPYYYLSDLSRLRSGVNDALALLFYQALDVTQIDSSLSTDEQMNQVIAQVTGGDATDPKSLLGQVLAFWSARLVAAGYDAGFYASSTGNTLIQLLRQAPENLRSLILGTKNALQQVMAARKNILGFLAKNSTDPTEAITDLTTFGANLVDAFSHLQDVYGNDDVLRALSTLAFTQTARVLSGQPGKISALFDAEVVNVDATTLPASGPTAAQIVAGNRLLATDIPAALPEILPPYIALVVAA